jgi:hypothetical protein
LATEATSGVGVIGAGTILDFPAVERVEKVTKAFRKRLFHHGLDTAE